MFYRHPITHASANHGYKRRGMLVALVVPALAMFAGHARASMTTVNPDLQGSTSSTLNTSSSPGFQTNSIYFGSNGVSTQGEYQGWLQYTIPAAPSPTATLDSAEINFTGLVDQIPQSPSGLDVAYVSNDNWDGSNIYYDRFSDSGTIVVVYPGVSLHSSESADITDYFDGTVASTGPGDKLSIKVSRHGGGNRRGYTPDPVTVTLNYSNVPEPASIVLLGMGGVACLCGRRRHKA